MAFLIISESLAGAINDIINFINGKTNSKGLNITIPVLDAVMCHNGEIALGEYKPMEKTVEDFLEEYKNSYHDKELIRKLKPMTLEGCVVRVSDLIAYLGRDIEDGIRMNLISYEDYSF